MIYLLICNLLEYEKLKIKKKIYENLQEVIYQAHIHLYKNSPMKQEKIIIKFQNILTIKKIS